MNIVKREMCYVIKGGEFAAAELRDEKEIRSSKAEVRNEIPQWKLVETAGIKWVRLVHDRRGVYGIGFYKDDLVYFLGTQITHGLVRRVSAFESIVLLRCLAGRELALQPDVESNSAAWKRWLSLVLNS